MGFYFETCGCDACGQLHYRLGSSNFSRFEETTKSLASKGEPVVKDVTFAIDALVHTTVQMAELRRIIDGYADVRTECVTKLRHEGYTLADISRYINVSPQAVAKIANRNKQRAKHERANDGQSTICNARVVP